VLTVGSCPARSETRSDNALLLTLTRHLHRVEAAERLAHAAAAGADVAQVQYDAARDLEEGLRLAEPVGPSCRPLLRAARGFAQAEVLQAEGVDRPAPTLIRIGVQRAAQARKEIELRRRTCRPALASAPPPATVSELETPLSGEAFFGLLSSRTPPGTAFAEIGVRGRQPIRVPVFDDRLLYRLHLVPGRYDIAVSYVYASKKVVGRVRSRDVWLLPSSAEHATHARAPDPNISRRLVSLARGFRGYSGIWLHDLTSGRTGEWNADARFPAASTVKLAVLIAALGKFGPRPERSRVAYDLKALTAWSSNLASNRLLDALGGSESRGSAIAQAVLERVGAYSSTFTGDYRIGTVFAPRDTRNPPPPVSSRVTTARDLGRILFQLQAAALGRRAALAATGLTRHEARVGLALLLSSESRADNLGLFRPAVGRDYPMAQKNGWFSAVRHTAALLYAPEGPKIAILLTYRPGITRAEAARLGARIAAIAIALR
jgi:beta-lactamase class A